MGNNCFTPTSSNCLVKHFNYFTKKDYTEKFLTFNRTEQRRSNVMISARIQLFCRKHNTNISYFNGKDVCPRIITERTIASKLHKNNFCLLWRSHDITFNEAIQELNYNFKIIDSVLTKKTC